MSDKATFVEDLTENEFVQSSFLVAVKERRTTRNDDPYLRLELTDRSGSIEGRIWDDVDMLADRFDVDDFVAVRARVSSYNDELQLNVDDIRRVDESEVTLDDYFPHSQWPADDLFAQLRSLFSDRLQSPELRKFIRALFADDDLVERFKRAPAAKSNHHDYFGGLLEHTLSMARLATRICDHYDDYYPDFLDADLVLCGCLLHDLGKVRELSYDRSIQYSTSGKLVGHVAQGLEIVGEAAARMDESPPESMLRHLKHLVLSHHGHREYGAPVEPQTPEAALLHEIDMIDSRMNLFHGHLAEHRTGETADEAWTSYHGALDSQIYAGPQSPPEWSDAASTDDRDLLGPGLRESEPEEEPEGGRDEDDGHTVDMFD